MKDTFIDPLLHPFSTPTIASPISSTPNVDYVYYQADSSTEPSDHDHLPPIAARFMSPTPTNGHRGPSASSTRVRETPNIDGESLDTDDEHDADDSHIDIAFFVVIHHGEYTGGEQEQAQ